MATPNKFLRLLSWTVITFISIIVIIPVGVFLYFDPNDYKTEISHFITEKSGLPLEINGKIELKLFPWLGFSVADVSGDFIKIEKLDLKVPVKELFHHRLIVESLMLEGVSVNLVKNQDGTTNWEYASKQFKQNKQPKGSENAQSEPTDNNAPNQTKKKLNFELVRFDVSGGNVTYEDKTQGDVITISKLQLKGKQGKAKTEFPVEGNFELAQKGDLLLTGNVDFNGSVTFTDKISAFAKTKLKLDMPQNPAAFRKIEADAEINLQPNNVITLEKMNLKVGEQVITGKVKVPQDADLPITFVLKTNTLDLNKLNKASDEKSPAVANNKAAANQAAKPAKSAKSSSARPITGEIVIDKLLASNIQLTNVRAIVNKTRDQVKINPLTASLYQGSLSAQISKTLNNSSAPVLIQGDLNNIQIQPLLMSLKNEKRLTGVANINFNLAQSHDVNGVVKVDVKNGVLDGMDVRYYLSLAQSLVSKDKTPIEDAKQTPFGNLSATLKIHDQMVDNNDLTITSSDFKANGEGSIYLGSKTIEYKMQAVKVHKDNQEHPNDYPLAIRIKGSFDHPKIEPDMDVYLKKGLEQEIKKQLGKQVEKNIGKILGSPNAQTDGQPGDANNELQQKIEDKINKGLNKLFKKKE